MITGFIPVFEERLQNLKKSLKNELQRAKSERRKDVMKTLVKDAKKLQKTINEVKKENTKICPHCGGELQSNTGQSYNIILPYHLSSCNFR